MALQEKAVGRGLTALTGLELDRLTEQQVVAQVIDALGRRHGGWLATLNVELPARLGDREREIFEELKRLGY